MRNVSLGSAEQPFKLPNDNLKKAQSDKPRLDPILVNIPSSSNSLAELYNPSYSFFAPILVYGDLIQGNVTINGFITTKPHQQSFPRLVQFWMLDIGDNISSRNTSSTPISFMAKASNPPTFTQLLWSSKAFISELSITSPYSQRKKCNRLTQLKYVRDSL
ncbi:hypothetical protein Tco_0892768 [Tanacetum coccineum]|uniref:Uncharacterized protein n=1 Tax=Tanacetum coccineum TaxID=301880 RepID=A0ABQ5CA27_9ASTR